MTTTRTTWWAGRRAAWLAAALALVATFFGMARERELARREQVIRWQESFSQLQPALQPLLFGQFVELHTTARNLLQRRRDYSGTAWEGFLQAVEWRDHFPGMLALGYAESGVWRKVTRGYVVFVGLCINFQLRFAVASPAVACRRSNPTNSRVEGRTGACLRHRGNGPKSAVR